MENRHPVGVTGRLWRRVTKEEKTVFKQMAEDGFSFRDIGKKFNREHRVVAYALKDEFELLKISKKLKAKRLRDKRLKPTHHVALMKKLNSCVQQARKRSEKRGMVIDIDIKFLLELYKKQGGHCVLTGLLLEVSSEKNECRCNPYSISLDRIDSSKGYIKGNVRLVVWCINWMLGEWGEKEFEEIAKTFLWKKYGVNFRLIDHIEGPT